MIESRILPFGPLRQNLRREMGFFREGKRDIPHEYVKTHERAAYSDMHRMLEGMNCTLAGTGMYDTGEKYVKFMRVFGDDKLTGKLWQFFWSDKNGGSWYFDKACTELADLPTEENRVGEL